MIMNRVTTETAGGIAEEILYITNKDSLSYGDKVTEICRLLEDNGIWTIEEDDNEKSTLY